MLPAKLRAVPRRWPAALLLTLLPVAALLPSCPSVPQAHFINMRCMEVFRGMGGEEECV